MSDPLVINNFIDGEFVAPRNGQYIDNFHPATGKVYGKLADSDKSDVDAAVQAAKRAFKTWSKTTPTERSKLLNKVADLIESRLQEFAEAESRDQGKPVTLAKTVDIPRVCSNFRFFAGAILHHQETSNLTDNTAINYTIRTPVGVAGLISPWNLPLYLLTWKVAPALAVGNTIVCKPSEFTPVTAWLMCSVMKEAGIPAGVVNVVFGRGVQTGKSLVEHPEVPLISFTGGTQTGVHIIRDSAPHFKKLYLELGGKNPNIIFDDANLDECIPNTVRSSFSNQGEICLCGSRILVQEGIYQKFLDRFVAAAKKLVVGDPTQPSTNMGPLVSKEHYERVKYYVELGRQEGGQIVCGGDFPSGLKGSEFENGYFLNPTIITNLPATCRTQQEEIFGPVVGITTFKTEEEAIAIANGTPYGLASSLWTQDLTRAHRVAHQIDAGTVWINCWMLRDLRAPFGGVKHSGLGRASGDHSIDFYTELKNICIKLA
jgi:aminomuconate-semialdehyde/2-hydroxymuconate-6-semialdehyde dehydrogenase